MQAEVKNRISSTEFQSLAKDKQANYIRYCGSKEVYYVLSPNMKSGHCGESSTVAHELGYTSHQKIDRILWHPILGTVDQVPSALKEWRVMRDFTLRQVEQETGISNAYLSQLETGKVSNPSFEIVVKLCRCYGVKIII